MLFAFYSFDFYSYDPLKRLNWRRLIGGWSLGIGLAFTFHFLLKIPYSRFAFLFGALLFFVLVILSRFLEKYFSTIFSEKIGPVIVSVGLNESAQLTRAKKNIPASFQFEKQLKKADISPPFTRLQEITPDIILVNGSLPVDFIRELTAFGRRRQVAVLVWPEAEQLFYTRTAAKKWRDLVLLEPRMNLRLQHQFVLKYLLDYFFGLVLLFLTLPLILLISVIILAVEGRPVFYTQERIGRDGKKFKLYKFRTMVPEAEKEGKLTRGADDPRITAVGKFLRRWSLDELPQLYNVLRGEMSLVGPRPELASITDGYSSCQRRVFWLKPGLTGLSQVSGRENLELEEKLKIDQYYVNEYSLLLDLQIFLKTFYVVLRGEGNN